MSTIRKFEKPLGMRDSFPLINEKKENVRDIGRLFLKSRGFDFIKTPTVEYYETIGKASAIADSALFKLVDRQGETLVLRPDMTTPIVRVATSKLLHEKNPLRLAYFANVFRAQEQEGGRPAEFEQMGVELFGDVSVYADAEMIITASELLNELGVMNHRLTVGHAGLLHSILSSYTNDESQVSELRSFLVEKNIVGFEEAVRMYNLDEFQETKLLLFIEQVSDVTSIEELTPFIDTQNTNQTSMFAYFKELSLLLKSSSVSEKVTYDLTLTSEMSYYTGMLFEVFASGSGFAIGNGGRYDGLLTAFESTVGATGFGLRVDRLLEVMPLQDSHETHTLLLFDTATYKDAVKKAQELRQSGIRTTIQLADSIKEKDEFVKNFTDVYWLTAGGGQYE